MRSPWPQPALLITLTTEERGLATKLHPQLRRSAGIWKPHAEQSPGSDESVTLTFPFYFHATRSGFFFLHCEITNWLRLSTHLLLEECTVSTPCRLLDTGFCPPLLLSLPTFGFIYMFCYFLSSPCWLSVLHPR